MCIYVPYTICMSPTQLPAAPFGRKKLWTVSTVFPWTFVRPPDVGVVTHRLRTTYADLLRSIDA